MIYYIFAEVFAGADLSFYILVFCVIFAHFAVKALRRKMTQYRYDRKEKIEEDKKAYLIREEMKRFEEDQIERITKEDFWYE